MRKGSLNKRSQPCDLHISSIVALNCQALAYFSYVQSLPWKYGTLIWKVRIQIGKRVEMFTQSTRKHAFENEAPLYWACSTTSPVVKEHSCRAFPNVRWTGCPCLKVVVAPYGALTMCGIYVNMLTKVAAFARQGSTLICKSSPGWLHRLPV